MFKKGKRIASFIILVCMSVVITGCAGSGEPKDVVDTFMSSLQQYNIAKPMMLMVQAENGSGGVKGNGDFSKVDFKDKTTNDYLKAMLTNIEYKIISVDQKGKEATVKAEVKTVDVETLMKNYMAEKTKQMQQAMKDADKTSNHDDAGHSDLTQAPQAANKDMTKMTDDEIKTMEKTLTEAIHDAKDVPKKTSNIEVQLVKKKGEWKVKPTDKLMKVIFGGQ